MRPRSTAWVVGVTAACLVGGCGDGGPMDEPRDPDRASRCQAVRAPVVEAIESSLDRSVELSDARMVSSSTRPSSGPSELRDGVFFVAAKAHGGGLGSSSDVAVWAVGHAERPTAGPYAANPVAEEVSGNAGPTTTLDALGLGPDADGLSAAVACVDEATGGAE